MPNNCSTLIQRKQNILHKILRSSSDGKLQNAVAETTAELCVSGTRKTPAHSPASSTHHFSIAAATSNVRRSNLFATNRIQPASNHLYEAHLPSIRDSHGAHDFQSDSRTPLTNNSPKSVGRPPSASISSIFHTLAKRSSENFTNTYGDYEELNTSNPVPPSRRSHRPHKMNGVNSNSTKQTVVPQKLLGYNEIDLRFSNGSADTSQQQQRGFDTVTRYRSNAAQTQTESPVAQNPMTKERTHFGSLYQRRQNNSVKAPSKQKIDKYRRRSEEVTQAMNGSPSTNNGQPSASPAAAPPVLTRPKLPTTSPVASVRRVASDGEMQARLDVLRLSMDANPAQTEQSKKSQPYQQQPSRHSRVKSPYLYSKQQQIKPATPVLNPQVPPVRLRRSHTPNLQGSSVNSSQHQQNIMPTDGRSSRQQSVKISTNASPGNLYLAFIASRRLSSLEDALLECDIDHQKLLRIFTWLKGVEDHRREQDDHDQLLIEQDQRMLDEEDDLSLYSEIQHAVDDLPANVAGKPCERIATMQFED